MFPGMSTVPESMTACAFPTANGAGSPAGSAVTARWTISSRSRGVLLWRQWRPLPQELPLRRLPMHLSPEKNHRNTCCCHRLLPITELCWIISEAVEFPWKCWTSAFRPGGFMKAGTRAMEMWYLLALIKPEKRGSAAGAGLATHGSTEI